MGNLHLDQITQFLFCLDNLSLSYRAKPVLRGINWHWRTGEHWAVVGGNGAGKSSLAAVLSGEQTHFSGRFDKGPRLDDGTTAFVCFERGRRLCERDRKLDCAEFESDARDAGTRVRDLVPDLDALRTRFPELVPKLDLERLLDRGLRFLSTGEMRKTLLANALLNEPELLILDSPLDGLDRSTQAVLKHALEDIMATCPAVLMLCRDLEDLPNACTHLLILHEGRVVAAGPRDAVLAKPEVSRILEPPQLQFQPRPLTYDIATAPDHTPTIALDGVTVFFGDLCVFRDLHWRFERGQHCLIAGPNGSGKSTLLDLLTGDNHKAYGQPVSLFGQRRGSGESIWEIKARFGRVDARMQNAMPSGSTVLDVVCSGFFDSLGLYDRPSDRQRSLARQWLESLDLAAQASAEFATLSFGLQRLVLLARAMVKEPPILLLDEATLNLDAGHRRLFLTAVDHLIDAGHTQLLFVSHTAADRPRCINQLLEFEPGPEGSSVRVTNL